MVYNIIATDEMDILLDNCVRYLLNNFKSNQAAEHLLSGVTEIYDTLENYAEHMKIIWNSFSPY